MTIQNKDTEKLYEAILKIEDINMCYAFFEDLCTIKEIQSMSQRLEVAQLLRDKKTFSEIVEKTGASTATISRVNKCLMYGTGGYNSILDRLNEN